MAHDAAACGDLTALLKFGDLLKLFNDQQENVMHTAIRANQLTILNFLLNNYSQFATQTNIYDETPLHLAVNEKSLEMVRQLLPFCPESAGNSNYTALQKACWAGQWEIVALMIQTEPKSVNQICNMKQTVLHKAVQSGDAMTVRCLLTLCPWSLLKSQDVFGQTPLHWAMQKSLEIAKLLANAEPSAIWVVDENDKSPMFYIDRVEMLEMLLEIDPLAIYQRDANNFNVFHFFLCIHDTDFCAKTTELLLRLSPAVFHVTSEGYSALDLAYRFKRQRVINIIFRAKPHIKQTNHCDHTLLHIAACGGDVAIVERIFTNIKHLYQENNRQKTPLDIAIKCKHSDVVKFFQPYITIDMVLKARELCLENCNVDLYADVKKHCSLHTYLLSELSNMILEFF